MEFETAFQLFRQARTDAGLDLEQLSKTTEIEPSALQAFEDGKLDPQLSTAALNRIEQALKLPESSLLFLLHKNDPDWEELSAPPVQRVVTYQNFITPAGFEAWVDVLRRLMEVSFVPDEDGEFPSDALPKARTALERQIQERTMMLYHQGEISGGRARELLKMSPFDALPRQGLK